MFDDQTMHNDLWEFDFVKEKWTNRRYNPPCPALPQARMYHVSVVTPTGKLIVFGGRAQTTTGFLNDLFEVSVDLADFSVRLLDPSGMALPLSWGLDLRTMEWAAIDDVSFGGRTRPTTVVGGNTVLTFGGCVHGNGYVNDFVEVELEPMTLFQCVGLSNDVTAQQGPALGIRSVHELLRPVPTAAAP
eukprot:gene15994-22289_t